MRAVLTKAGLAMALGFLSLPPAQAVDLAAAYQSALSYDADLQAARAGRLEAEEGVPMARAGLLPQIAYNLQRNLANTTNRSLTTGQSSSIDGYFSESSSLTVRQPIYRKSVWAGLDVAQAQSEAADANYQKEEQNLGLRVAGTYLDVLRFRSELALAEAENKAMEAQVVLAEKALKNGTGARPDVDEARARHDMARATVLAAKMRLSQAAQDFRTVTDIDAARVPEINPRALPGRPLTIAGRAEWMERIEAASPDIQSLRKQLEAASAEVERAKGGHHPSLDLVLTQQEGKSESNTTLNTRYTTKYIGFQLSVPLVSGFGVMAQVRQTDARAERIRQSLESTRRKTLAEAERLYFAVEQGVEKVEALEQAIVSAEQALLSAQKGIRAGTRTFVDVLNSERGLYLARRDQAVGIFELAGNRLKFLALANAIDGDAIKLTSGWLASAGR